MSSSYIEPGTACIGCGATQMPHARDCAFLSSKELHVKKSPQFITTPEGSRQTWPPVQDDVEIGVDPAPGKSYSVKSVFQKGWGNAMRTAHASRLVFKVQFWGYKLELWKEMYHGGSL